MENSAKACTDKCGPSKHRVQPLKLLCHRGTLKQPLNNLPSSFSPTTNGGRQARSEFKANSATQGQGSYQVKAQKQTSNYMQCLLMLKQQGKTCFIQTTNFLGTLVLLQKLLHRRTPGGLHPSVTRSGLQLGWILFEFQQNSTATSMPLEFVLESE